MGDSVGRERGEGMTTTDVGVAVSGVAFAHDAERFALEDVSFDARPGTVTVLLGPNGAGKSTTFDLLLGLRAPARGSVSVLGRSPREAVDAGLIGFASQATAVYPRLSPLGNLELFARYYGLGRDPAREAAQQALARFAADGMPSRPVGHLSGGQARVVHLAAATVGGPPVVVLDEPTVGIDLAGRHRVAAAIRQLAREQVVVIISTHQFDDAERVADTIVVIHEGRTSHHAPIEEARRSAPLLELHDMGDDDVQASPVGPMAQGEGGLAYVDAPDPTAAVGVVEVLNRSLGREVSWRYIPSGVESFYLRTLAELDAASTRATEVSS